MKTFVTDDYQVTLMDNGGVKVTIYGEAITHIIRYDPSDKKPWSEYTRLNTYARESEDITGLNLNPYLLKKLHEALTVVNKQDLMDNEIIFVK